MASRSAFELNDDSQFETLNFRMENRTTDPSNGLVGSAYFNTVLNCVRVKQSVGWVNYSSASNSPIPYLYNCKPLQFQALNRASGNWDMGTVPAGKKWLVVSMWFVNATAGTIVATPRLLSIVASRDLLVGQSVSVLASNVGSIQNTTYPIMMAGDVLRLHLDVAGLSANVQVWEFDSDSPVFSAYKDTLTAGDNLVYTCPAGKKAYPLSFSLGTPCPGSFATSFIYSNRGVLRTIYGNLVKSGGTALAPGVGSNCLRPVATAVAQNNISQVAIDSAGACLEPGDFVSINTSAIPFASQQAWLTVLEL